MTKNPAFDTLIEEKLNELTEWHWEKHRGHTSDTNKFLDVEGDIPMYRHVDSVKPIPCDRQVNKTGCYVKIRKGNYSNKTYWIQRCETCEMLITPDGNLMPMANQVHTNPIPAMLALDREIRNKREKNNQAK